jgi:hypothetical protein
MKAQYGDRDPNMDRWEHHRKKGEIRKHWDYVQKSFSWRDEHHFRFGDDDMVMLFKLTWGN